MRRVARSFAALVLCACAALVTAPAARGATITIVNADTSGEGFSDPTPVAPIGGNPGTTLGAQRLNVFQQAANVWGALLSSSVTIRVLASFDPLACSPTSGVLGSAGPQTAHRNFAGAEFTNTWYHQALANKEAGTDLAAGTDDIRARFNRDVDNGTCLGSTNWYYGFDGNEGNNVDLLPVVLHELGHGLGFSTLVNGATGAEFSGSPDLFERFLFDAGTGKLWTQMTDFERSMSATNTQNLVWNGISANIHAWSRQSPRPIVTVIAPGAIAGVYSATGATFGASLASPGVESTVVQANDGIGTTSDACSALLNGAAMSGNIALIDRAACSFTSAVLNCQNAGAVGVIVVNNVAGLPVTMGGSSGVITIPAVMVSQANGNTIRAQLAGGVTARIGIDIQYLAGMHASRKLMMYAPSPFQGGSSVSHWDVSLTPNALMEPAINSDLSGVDLTLDAFEDLGWLPRTTTATPSQPGLTMRSSAPNPFRVSTTIRFDVARAGLAQLAIYDVNGRRVTRLANQWFPAGAHTMQWDGTDQQGRPVAPGVYLSRLTMAHEVLTGRLVRVE